MDDKLTMKTLYIYNIDNRRTVVHVLMFTYVGAKGDNNQLYQSFSVENTICNAFNIIVLVFLLVVIAALYLSRPGGSNKFEKVPV